MAAPASAAMAAMPPLDLEALLAGDYRPARVSRLVLNDLYAGAAAAAGAQPRRKPVPADDGADGGDAAAVVAQQQQQQRRKRLEEETSRLVLSLVAHTPAFARHLPAEERAKQRRAAEALLWKEPRRSVDRNSRGDDPRRIPSAFHPVNLVDWEKEIDWDGTRQQQAQVPPADDDPLALIRRPRNPHLENLVFDRACLAGDADRLLEQARRAPLILELAVAGGSVARRVYQNTALTAQRPLPAAQTEEYQARLDRDWTGGSGGPLGITSTAELSRKGSLHADKEKMEALIAERQKKRAEMAKDKTNRVLKAMGTLAMGGGRGRTITSSLMGPGGTERTGRPSRHMGSAMSHEAEYVEQLDLVTSHALSRDPSKVSLREFHRPKLPYSVVRQDLAWQFQIRYISAGRKGADDSKSVYQSVMVGTHPGSISKAKIRAESDLSPTEGNLILVEYSEERPPIFLSKGMASKIVNYYRGDKARCPVSAGGGDRPARRKRGGEQTSQDAAQNGRERLPRLDGPNRATTVTDWIGKLPKRTQKERAENEAIDILPEGVTEILHPKVHGPFLGEVDEGATVTGLISNLFVAPMFRHEPESTDFLMVLTPPSGAARPGERESMGVVLRDFPTSCFTVGQTEPRARVYAPNSQGEKNFLGPWMSYQIARALTRSQTRDGHGLRFDELQDRVLPNLDLPANTLRQRLKQVAIYDKNTGIWTTKPVGYEDYPGLEALGKSIAPEGEACFESANAASRRLADLGITRLVSGTHAVASIGMTIVYLVGQLNAVRELSRKMKKLTELSRSNKSIPAYQITYYEKAAFELDLLFKTLRQRHELAQFIYEELQLTPWHLTGEFIEVHKKGEGTGMMKLTGLGDPSGQGEGFSFLREADSKPVKSIGANDALNEQVKKITGTADDLRKLTMKQMAALLRSYGMGQKQIDTLKRWDRVHVIRDLSTKAASDGIGDGLERFARGEKLKLSEQKQMYHDRIQVIWRRQIAALSMDASDKAMGLAGADANGNIESVEEETNPLPGAQTKVNQNEESSDSDSDDDDDLAATLEEEMIHRAETHELVAAHAGIGDNVRDLGRAVQDKDLTMDARELAAWKRQREEDRQTQEGMQVMGIKDDLGNVARLGQDRKVIRRRITKTHPDGRQTITFKFIVLPQEVGKIIDRLHSNPETRPHRNRETKYEYGPEEKPPGHAMFEDEDDFEYSSKGRHSNRRRVPGRKNDGQVHPRARALHLGKLKTKVSTEERMRKRQREENELEVYSVSAKRKGTSNRRERGSIRDRRPHVIFAEKLESIRAAVETRPMAGPFLKPVNRKLIPRYYEVISHPIDLSTIRDKINRYEYRTADGLIKDFELMKNNAVKFNGPASPIAAEAVAIYDFVRDQVESHRADLMDLEEAVKEQMEGKPKKKRKSNDEKKSIKSTTATFGGVNINLGDLSSHLHGVDSDSDESFAGLLDM